MKSLILAATIILGSLSFTSCSKSQQEILSSKNVTVDFSGIQAEENTVVTFLSGLDRYTFDMSNGLVQSQDIPADEQYKIQIELTSHEQNTGCRYLFRSEYTDMAVKAATTTLSIDQPQDLGEHYTFEISCR